MTFFYVMSSIILAGLGLTVRLFRKGGIYNPVNSDEPLETHSTPQNIPLQLVTESNPTPMTKNVISTSQSSIAPSLKQLCEAMRDFEGQKINARGVPDPNWANNNALNCKYYYGGYLPKYGKVLRSPAGFAIFSTYEIGFMYGYNMIKNKIAHHPNWTILDLIKDHAPSGDDNDPVHYAQVVSKRIGVDSSFLAKNLS